MSSKDTISAISTAFGNAGIAIIRISGDSSLNIIKNIFFSEKKPIFDSHKMYLGKILDKGDKQIDEVLTVYFKGPNSFTGEDMVEINCHGGYITAQKVLARVLEAGARVANPGEFTERAFLNGKIDLTQAEAIADIIYAKSDKAQSIAEEQLAGYLSFEVKKILNRVLDVYAHIATDIDFPDEEVPELSFKDIAKKIKSASLEVGRLLKSSKIGTVYKEGLKVAIVGLPNAGKSSLLNALAKDARAIVTEIPGTTRDVLEDQIEIDGVLVRLFDTAGITKTEDRVEKEGVERSIKAIEKSDIILLVVEKYKDVEKFLNSLKEIAKNELDNKEIILVRSKRDISFEDEPENLTINPISICEISAIQNKGIKKLEKLIIKNVKDADSDASIYITNLRQKKLLEDAKKSLNKIVLLAKKEEPEDKILIELDTAKKTLESIIGQSVTEDMLEKVFSRFCVGK